MSIDDPQGEEKYLKNFVDARTPEHEFDRAWVLTVLERASRLLRGECDARGRVGRFAVYLPYRHGNFDNCGISEDAARLGLSEDASRLTLRRIRERLRDLVFREIRQTVASSGEMPGEVRYLLAVVGTVSSI